MNWHEDSQMIEECLEKVNAYFDMLTKSRAIQIGIERKLRAKIKETMKLIERMKLIKERKDLLILIINLSSIVSNDFLKITDPQLTIDKFIYFEFIEQNDT